MRRGKLHTVITYTDSSLSYNDVILGTIKLKQFHPLPISYKMVFASNDIFLFKKMYFGSFHSHL